MVCSISGYPYRQRIPGERHIMFGTGFATALAFTCIGGYHLFRGDLTTREFKEVFAGTTGCALSTVTILVVWARGPFEEPKDDCNV